MAGAATVIFVRLIEASPIALGFYRLGFSVILFAIPIILGGYKDYKGITKKEVGICILAGAMLFSHFMFWFSSLQMTSIASAFVLFSLNPLILLIPTYFFLKKRVSGKAVIGIIVALAGSALIVSLNQTLEDNTFLGDVSGFLAGIFFALYFFIGQIMRAKLPMLNYVFIVFSSCFVFFAIAMVVTGTPLTGYRTEDYILMFSMALVCQVLAHALYNWCMGYVSALYVSVFTTTQTAIAILYGIIFFREIPEIFQVIGAVIVVAGLLYYNYNSMEKQGGICTTK
jgi:drug/metabolite transporter (DMT)-like permease